MAGLANQFLHGTSAGGPDMRDYRHAARTFVDGLYRLSPKIGAMFHVFIELNPAITQQDPQNPAALYEIGLMAKTAQLPKYTIQNKIFNSYNRKSVIQERINYDPITLTFHDDSSDVVRNFWNGYYSYYYRDSDYSEALYNQDYKYKPRQVKNWGFSPKFTAGGTPNYINAVRIYSLHQKSFSSYILFRPTIQSFQHGLHTMGEYTPMEHTMTFAYEAVQYEYGPVSSGTVMGFDIIHYDNHPSPIAGTGNQLADILINGLVETAGLSINNLQNGNFGLTGSLGAFNNFKNSTIVPSSALAETAQNILRGQNTQSTVFFPTSSSVQEGLAGASPAIPGLIPPPPTNGIDNINTQDNQVNSSNQGVAEDTQQIYPDFTPISVAGNQVPGEVAITDSNNGAPNYSGGYVPGGNAE